MKMDRKSSASHLTTGGSGKGERITLKRCTLYLEDEHLEMLDELAREYTERLGQRWTRSAVIRLALSDFLTKIGKMA